MANTTPPMPAFPPPPSPAPKRTRTNTIIITSAAAVIVAIVVTGVAVANSNNGSKAAPAPTVTVTETETTEMTDQEILDQSVEILASAEADIDAGLEPDVTIPAVEEPEPTEEEEPAGPATSMGSGTYLVGEDVKAGTYKTSGPTDGMCYWSRNSNDSGELDAIIANDILEGPGRVTVNKGEIFETSGCEEWELAK